MRTGDRYGLVSFVIGVAASMVPAGGRSSWDQPRRERSWRGSGGNIAHQGERELARRRRQIREGQLREQNGLERNADRG